jgi:hypothetical protein
LAVWRRATTILCRFLLLLFNDSNEFEVGRNYKPISG